MFARFDTDGSGGINLNEFLMFMDDIDHAWIRIQTKTFTRWANTVLSNRMEKIETLVEGIKDGLKLVGVCFFCLRELSTRIRTQGCAALTHNTQHKYPHKHTHDRLF